MGIGLKLIDKDTCQAIVETELARYWRAGEWLEYFQVEKINGHSSEVVGEYIQTAVDKLAKNGHFPEVINYRRDYFGHEYKNDYTEFATKLKSMLDMAKKNPDCVWFTEHASTDPKACHYETLLGERPYHYPKMKQI